MNRSNKPIVVFGGTGHYGSHIVQCLLEKGEAVKVLSRNAGKAREILGHSPEIIEGDITSRGAVIQSLEGSKAVVIAVSAFNWKTIKKIRQIERNAVLMILEEAKRVNISRILYLSGYELREEVLRKLHALKLGKIKLEIEATLARSAFNWTILGCAPSMELFFAFLRNSRMMVPGGGLRRVPTISSDDVGEITAQIVIRNDLKGKRFRLTGPEALSFPEGATRISQLTGKSVKFVKIPLLPLKIASIIALPINPYLRYIFWSLTLLNNFPQDLAAKLPEDHQLLRETFDYTPTTFEMEVRKRSGPL